MPASCIRLSLALSMLLFCSLAAKAEVAGDTFNYVVGTQAFSPAYQFTKEAPLVEQAKAILALGSNTIKFPLTLDKREIIAPEPGSLVEIARNSPAVRAVLDMPFANYLLWAYPIKAKANLLAPETFSDEYRELYDLTRYLLRTYSGTGKSFYLGNWEGDWHLLHMDPNYQPTAEEIQHYVDWVNMRQKAVTDARRDTPEAKGVHVYFYVEVNRVVDAMQGKKRVTNAVLPSTDVDFVSYSSYDSIGGDVAKDLPRALDYIASQMKPRADITGKRAFIGEFGFPAIGNTPAEQEAKSRAVLRIALKWKCPFVLYWQIYNNEVTPEGKQRGFWLIDDKGVKQPVYNTLHDFYTWTRKWRSDWQAHHRGRLPDAATFDEAAIAWLAAAS